MTPELRQSLLSALAWQIELGADEAISDAPVDRFGLPDAPASSPATPQPRGPSHAPAAIAAEMRGDGTAAGTPRADVPDASALAAAARSLDDLAEAERNWPGSALREGARNFVFCDGNPAARLMVIGEAPGAEEDRIGKPFVGRAGQLLDRMLAAIGLSRTAPDAGNAVYITNILPWRPPGNRTPSEQEAAAFLPFVIRHIQLADPDIVLTMGNTPTKALLATTTGIKRMRGRWTRHAATGKPLVPSFHPAYLLRQPADKKLAWFDLIAVRKALGRGPARMTRILAFSDLHLARPRARDIVEAAKDADLVIGAGDFCNARQGLEEAMDLLWTIADKAIYVPGNAESAEELRAATEATVLHGEAVETHGLTVFGIGYAIPVTPFGDWSCDLTEEHAAAMLDRMQAADILISHSPPQGVADRNRDGVPLGSTAVRAAIERVQPRLCVCGHIHDSWGQTGRIGATTIHNLGPTPNWFEF